MHHRTTDITVNPIQLPVGLLVIKENPIQPTVYLTKRGTTAKNDAVFRAECHATADQRIYHGSTKLEYHRVSTLSIVILFFGHYYTIRITMADGQQQRPADGGLFDAIGDEYLARAVEENRNETSAVEEAEATGLSVEQVANFRRFDQQQHQAALRQELLGPSNAEAEGVSRDSGFGPPPNPNQNPRRSPRRRRIPRPLPAAGRPHRRDVSHRNRMLFTAGYTADQVQRALAASTARSSRRSGVEAVRNPVLLARHAGQDDVSVPAGPLFHPADVEDEAADAPSDQSTTVPEESEREATAADIIVHAEDSLLDRAAESEADGAGVVAAPLPVEAIDPESLRHGIIAESTTTGYAGEVFSFLSWVLTHQPTWLTEHATNTLQSLAASTADLRVRAKNKAIRQAISQLMREAHQQPILHLDQLTPMGYMHYIASLRHKKTHGYLSKSSYGTKRSALRHLFRLQNQLGFPANFGIELGNLYRGLHRKIAKAGRHQQATTGKEPMTPELLRLVSRWFLEWNTADGVFARAYLLLTWSLMCRVNSTAVLKLANFQWIDFDCLGITFGHTKVDQFGDDSAHLRHIYSNPHDPLVCPVLALAMFFTSCLAGPQTNASQLFEGTLQDDRFGTLLSKVLAEHLSELHDLGYTPNDLGTHSIRKGAVSYVSSLPGGPTVPAVCIRAGWSMGQVREIYMRYVSSGDQFVGRCLSMLPLDDVEFGSSCARFDESLSEADHGYLTTLAKQEFSELAGIDSFGRLMLRCYASLLHHRQWLLDLDPNHVVRRCSAALKDGGLMEYLSTHPGIIKVTHPWDDPTPNRFTGIPPHVSQTQKLMAIRNEQQSMVNDFVGKVGTLLEERGVGDGAVSVDAMKKLFKDLSADIKKQFEALGGGQPSDGEEQQQTLQELAADLPQDGGGSAQTGFQLHLHGRGLDSRLEKVPYSWEFPRVSVQKMWELWWVGDTVQQIPPMRAISIEDLRWLDDKPLPSTAMHKRTGPIQKRANRRSTVKMLSDCRVLMNWMLWLVQEANALPEELTAASVKAMYNTIEPQITCSKRMGTITWISVVKKLRREKRLVRVSMDDSGMMQPVQQPAAAVEHDDGSDGEAMETEATATMEDGDHGDGVLVTQEEWRMSL